MIEEKKYLATLLKTQSPFVHVREFGAENVLSIDNPLCIILPMRDIGFRAAGAARFRSQRGRRCEI